MLPWNDYITLYDNDVKLANLSKQVTAVICFTFWLIEHAFIAAVNALVLLISSHNNVVAVCPFQIFQTVDCLAIGREQVFYPSC